MSRLVLGHVRPRRSVIPAPRPAVGAPVRASERQGRMPVILTIYGGDPALSEVMEGLVERNARSIREGAVPLPRNSGLTPDVRPGGGSFNSPQCWRDAVSALGDHRCSIGTMVAYRAAEARVAGHPASVGFVSGLPTVAYTDGVGNVIGYDAPMVAAGGPDALMSPRGDEVNEHMLLTLDDDKALPVCEINTAIARHNAHQIKERGLPELYESNIRYQTEGTPELWWDAQKIVLEGHDDCEGLAAYRAGNLINEGLESDVYCRYIKPPGNGKGRLFHAVTRVKDPETGRFVYDDPSVNAGKRIEGHPRPPGWVPGGSMPIPSWYRKWCAQRRAEGRDL